ncbi:MAG: hypothetical protein ABI395_07440 [Sphingobium sp.]
MSLNLIDIYSPALELWETRPSTLEESLEHGRPYWVQTRLRATIGSSMDAAVHIANVGTDQTLRNYINDKLNENCEYKAWRQAMPSVTPSNIADYQKSLSTCDLNAVSREIGTIGQVLPHGQCLFHAGVSALPSTFMTSRPVSTSFCPDVALRNAEHKGKAYHGGRIDLFVFEAYNPTTAMFVFRRGGTNLGHENEVLFASGAQVKTTASNLVRSDYPVSLDGINRKLVPIYVHTALIT